MNQQPPLRWRRHRLAAAPPGAVQNIVRNLAPAGSLARSAPGAVVEQDTIALPELPESPVDKAATLLRVAAQVEHALMVQYLYAGCSLTGASPARTVTGVAIEEMSHLMTVQNLLRLVGQPPHLHRQDDGDSDDEHRLFPFDFRFEPVSNVSLAKYIVAESPATAPEGVDPAVLEHIRELATGAQPDPVNRVGTLYALLSAVFGTPELLHEQATGGGQGAAWYAMVEQVAAAAAVFYGGPENLHLPDGALDAATGPVQGSDDDWDRSRTGTTDEFRVHRVTSRLEALEALRDIGLQGEGPSPEEGETAHFRRFYDLFVEFFGPDGLGTEPPQGAVLRLPAGARIVVDPGGADGEGVISHPTTAQWARLGDLRYTLLLGALERYLLAPAGERDFLRGWCFAEMYALHKLADLLRQMPAGTATTTTAALPFTPPAWPGDGAQWSDLAGAYEESRTIAAALAAEVSDELEGGPLLLAHLLASDERRLAESLARANGTTQRTRTDAVRDALDWAAGTGDPGHSDNGRFWNVQRADFVQVTIGSNITTPPAPGERAPLVEQLRTRAMPRRRPPLDELTSPEYKLVEKWVAEGCPDDPV